MSSSDRDDEENGEPDGAPDLFAWLSREVRELAPARVPRVDGAPAPLDFLREYVASNRPCVIRGAFDHWPARRRWSLAYLSDTMGDDLISVNVTPDGRGDALLATAGLDVRRAQDDHPDARSPPSAPARPLDPVPPEVFIQPEERRMTFREFARELERTREVPPGAPGSSVPYVSRQCGSLPDEFPRIARDCDAHIAWATEAFGHPPDAVNFWCGDERATTTFHRDHYENVYCVVTGVKTFALLPPCDAYRLRARPAPAATRVGDAVVLESPERSVRWSPIEPEDLKGDRSGAPPPLIVDVHPGECLYLPAMWHHHVTQRRGDDGEPAVAVNFWYDMAFDDRFAIAKFAEEAHRRFARGGTESRARGIRGGDASNTVN